MSLPEFTGRRGLHAALRRLYRRHDPPIGQPPAAFEARLLAEHRRRYPAKPRPGALLDRCSPHRLAVAVVALAALVIGACQLPIAYHRDFGVSFDCAADRRQLDPESAIGLADRLRPRIAADNISLQLLDEGAPTIRVRIDVWGVLAAPEAVLAAIRAELPGLTSECAAEPLEGTVHGTLGGRLGYALLDLDLDREDAAAARAQILERLRAEGFSGHAEVEVADKDGKREVKIRLEERLPAP
ncbi:MAG: hypothetical protein IPK80_13480 [Nannocystis sp.]|nr:hypothetical protein [Nannocystis sp.]